MSSNTFSTATNLKFAKQLLFVFVNHISLILVNGRGGRGVGEQISGCADFKC